MTLNPHWGEVIDVKGKGKAKAVERPPPAKAEAPPPKSTIKREPSKDLKAADGPSTLPKPAEKLKAGTLDWGKAKVKGAEASSSKASRTASDNMIAENGGSKVRKIQLVHAQWYV